MAFVAETLAMKGLLLNCLDKKTQAYEFVRKGLKVSYNGHIQCLVRELQPVVQTPTPPSYL